MSNAFHRSRKTPKVTSLAVLSFAAAISFIICGMGELLLYVYFGFAVLLTLLKTLPYFLS